MVMSSKQKIILAICVFLIIGAGVGTGMFFLMRKKNNTTPKKKRTEKKSSESQSQTQTREKATKQSPDIKPAQTDDDLKGVSPVGPTWTMHKHKAYGRFVKQIGTNAHPVDKSPNPIEECKSKCVDMKSPACVGFDYYNVEAGKWCFFKQNGTPKEDNPNINAYVLTRQK